MSRATIEILLATAATSIEVAFTLPGGTGVMPDGGAQFAVLQKQSAADGDFGWTNTPRVQALQLDLTTQPATLAEGQSRWNPTVRTVETNLGGPGGGVTLQHGFETFIRAANFTGVTIPNGKVVAFAGADIANEVPKIAPMLADGSILPLYTVGLTTEDIPDAGTVGRVTTFGEVHSLDTSGTPSSRIVVERAGLYDFGFSFQVAKTGGTTRNIWIWARHNGIDVPRSSQQKSIAGPSSTEVPAWNFTLSMMAGDYFELMWAVDNTEVFLDSDAAPAFGPSVPSVILTVAKINQ